MQTLDALLKPPKPHPTDPLLQESFLEFVEK